MKSIGWLLLLPWLALPLSSQSGRETVPTVVLKGGTLVDVHTGHEITNSLIVVEGDRIKQIGREADIEVPREARVIDAHGKWIIPGLMDMHAHISGTRNLPLELYLVNGVTTIRDPAGNLTPLRLARQDIDSGKRRGPRLFFSGYVLDGNPPLWPDFSVMADTPERAESAVNFLIDQGVDLIKVYNSVTEPALVAIVRTAHARGIPVTGHVPRSMTMTRAVELGMDGLEHIRVTGRELLPLAEADKIDFLPFVEREARLWQRFDLDSPRMKELVSFLAEKKIFLDPTLTVDELSSFALYEEQAKDPNNRFLPRNSFTDEVETAPDVFRLPPELKEAAAEGFRKRLQFIGMCSRAGVQIIAGTDGVGAGKLLPGFGLQYELGLLAQAGLTPIQVIQAATINAARALKKDEDLGSIEAGKLADMVILNASPLIDIRNTSNIDGVITGGHLLDRKALDGMLAQAEAAANPLVPRADHHTHLLSPTAAKLANDPPLPAIELPEDFARLLREREKGWNDKTALAPLFTEDSLVLDIREHVWIRGRAEVAEYLAGNFARPYRMIPITYAVEGSSGHIAGYFTRPLDDGSTRYFGQVLLSLKKGSDGTWRIAVESPTFPGPTVREPTTAEQLVAQLDEAGIQRGAVLSSAYWHGSPFMRKVGGDEYANVRAENDWTVQEVARVPNRLVAFCSFNPLKDYALEEIDRCAKLPQVKGLKLHFGNSEVDVRNPEHVEKVRRVFAAANGRRLAIVAHLWVGHDNTYGREHAEIFLKQILPAAPDIPVQIAHFAGGGPGYTDEALGVYAEAIAAGDPRTKNLYFDFATVADGQSEAVLQTFAKRIRQVGLNRVLYGTDLAPPTASQSWKTFRTTVPLTDDEFKTIAGNVAPYFR